MSLLACDPEEQHSPDFAESPLTLICEGLLGEISRSFDTRSI